MREEIFLDGRVRMFLGDCWDIFPMIGRVEAVVTDPPYGILVPGDFKGRVRDDRGGKHGLAIEQYDGYSDTYANFVKLIVPRLNSSLDICDRAVVFTGPHIHEQRKPNAVGGVYCSAAMGRNEWGFKNLLPVLLYGSAPDLNLGAKIPTAIASNATAEKLNHPCPKPLPWMKWAITLASRQNETVLDPFMGSGTTGIAAVNLGRKFIGIEIEPKYFDIACERIHYASGQSDMFSQVPSTKQANIFAEVSP